jgi:hypothetical protein
MDDERFQQMEKRLNEQAEATQAMNETLNKFMTIMSNIEAAKVVAPLPPVSPQLVTTPLQASQPSRVKPGIPSNFDGDRVQGRAFLTSCELSPHRTLSMSKCASIGHYPTSRVDARRASPSTSYGRSYSQGRCVSHPGATLRRNLCRHSAQRMRPPQCS